MGWLDLVFGCERGDKGQSTVEYLLVTMAFLSIVLALGAVWQAGRDGALLDRATASASHVMGDQGVLGLLRDITVF